jgi:CheY-like chemotaxis protein
MLDQTTMLLHQGLSELPERQRNILNDIYLSNKPLEERRVLIVDDDIRNIFALSSVLEEYGMKIVSAENGRDAIDILQNRHDIDIVLMDIMMPDMDGIDTMKEIRRIESCRNLPIVAVTAKAMVGDRERCIEAGAWDYLSKPVDREQLLSVLRAWLQR